MNRGVYLVFSSRDSQVPKAGMQPILFRTVFQMPCAHIQDLFPEETEHMKDGEWSWVDTVGLRSLQRDTPRGMVGRLLFIIYTVPCSQTGCKGAGWPEYHRTGSAKEFTSTQRHWFGRLYQKTLSEDSAGESGGRRGSKKSSSILSRLIFISSPVSPTSGGSQKLVGGL